MIAKKIVLVVAGLVVVAVGALLAHEHHMSPFSMRCANIAREVRQNCIDRDKYLTFLWFQAAVQRGMQEVSYINPHQLALERDKIIQEYEWAFNAGLLPENAIHPNVFRMNIERSLAEYFGESA